MLDPRAGGSTPIMPVDVAVTICLTSSPPLNSFLRHHDDRRSLAGLSLRCGPLRPCLASGRCGDALACGRAAGEDGAAWLRRKQKKSVVFADARGLALTAIHTFHQAEDEPPEGPRLRPSQPGGAAEPGAPSQQRDSDKGPRLALDFPQPASDYLDLRNRLRLQRVCLETCVVQDYLLSGTVQVRNICFEKRVAVRITFDSWRSFLDVPCCYLDNVYGCGDYDTFFFSVPVPEIPGLKQGVEFCIKYQTQDQTFWDNNQGTNYRLMPRDLSSGLTGVPEAPSGLPIQKDGKGAEADPLGSPRMSSGIFSGWKSWESWEQMATPYW